MGSLPLILPARNMGKREKGSSTINEIEVRENAKKSMLQATWQILEEVKASLQQMHHSTSTYLGCQSPSQKG